MFKGRSADVPVDSPLSVSYVFEEAEHPRSDSIQAMQHGINHGSAQFADYARAMRENHGIHTARIDIESRGNNRISLDQYVEAQHAALLQIRQETRLEIGTILGHSMGGQMTQELAERFEEWRATPKVLMTPVPLVGALPAFMRAVRKHPSMLWKSVKRLDIQDVMRTPEEVRALFFNEHTPETIVEKTTAELRHSSYRAYLSLLTRFLTRAEIEFTRTPALLMYSHTDALFGNRYDDLDDVYGNLEKKAMPGGHDFFIEYAQSSARYAAEFHKKHAS